MLYLMKFGASFVLPPGIFIVLFLLVALVLRFKGDRWLARLVGGGAMLLWLLATPLAAGGLMRNLESAYLPPENPAGDVVIMLGGGATLDTPDVDGTGGLCPAPANRLLTAVRLAKKLNVPLIVSGGQVYADTGTEAVIARRIAVSLGLPPEKVIMESESLNTDQNAKFTGEILAARGYKKPILVTSASHMRRAVEHFRHHGVEVTPYPADYQANLRQIAPHYNHLAPSAWALEMSSVVLRERLRYFVLTQFGR